MLEEYQERVIIELNELNVKLSKLNDFIESPNFIKLDLENQDLLKQQKVIMEQYADIVESRIKLFKN
jgi:hypothetical protein